MAKLTKEASVRILKVLAVAGVVVFALSGVAGASVRTMQQDRDRDQLCVAATDGTCQQAQIKSQNRVRAAHGQKPVAESGARERARQRDRDRARDGGCGGQCGCDQGDQVRACRGPRT